MLRVGLTGGIASGKSTVSLLLKEKGIPVIDSDKIARDLVQSGSEALSEIAEAFGPGVLAADGTLDRTRLGQIVFADESKRRELEGMLHPRIMAAQDRWLEQMRARGDSPVAVVDAALMIESGGWERFDRIVVVDCDESHQMARLADREGMDEETARARLASQMPLPEKAKYADRLVDNRGSLEDLKGWVDELAAWLLDSGPAARKKSD